MADAGRSTRLNTAYAVIDSYSSLSSEAMLAPLAPDFTHQVLPESLGMPTRDRDAFGAHSTRIFSVFSRFAMVPQAVFEDAAANAVVVYAKMVGELIGLGAWENECVVMMRMSHDGSQVVESKEFVDSAKANLLREKLTAKMNEDGAKVMDA
ncbi:hypothetical protein LTR60_004312 [Cryomyces antarcticus]|nr:hypothetical protein LTR60_004312 [Cryomyces antarcticus]KAK5133680.1 hypothetical protein LTR04_004752 [Oleoguttula sp. CCFEE 6159]